MIDIRWPKLLRKTTAYSKYGLEISLVIRRIGNLEIVFMISHNRSPEIASTRKHSNIKPPIPRAVLTQISSKAIFSILISSEYLSTQEPKMEIKDRVSNRLHRCHHWSKLDSSGWRHVRSFYKLGTRSEEQLEM